MSRTTLGFTLIELAIIIIVLIMICSLVVPDMPSGRQLIIGDVVVIRESGLRGVVVKTNLDNRVVVRIDNGPSSVPRCSEVIFITSEVQKLTEIETPTSRKPNE